MENGYIPSNGRDAPGQLPPGYVSVAGPEEEGLTLRDYLAVVWRRKWIILLVVIVATGAAYFFSARQD